MSQVAVYLAPYCFTISFALYITLQNTVSPRFFGLLQTGPCPKSEKVWILKIEYNTVLYCTVNSLYCLTHILIGYNMVQYAYIVYMREYNMVIPAIGYSIILTQKLL